MTTKTHLTFLFIITFITLLLFTTSVTSSITSTNLSTSNGLIRLHGNIECNDQCTRLTTINIQLNKPTATTSRLDINQINLAFYNPVTATLIVSKELAFSPLGTVSYSFTKEEQVAITTNSYIFDATMNYRNLSDDIMTFSPKISLEAIDGTTPIEREYTIKIDRSIITKYETTQIFPILALNNPRVFRLSAAVDLAGVPDSDVSRVLITPFASWTTRLREGVSEGANLGCFLNSLEYSTTILPTGQLSLDIRSRHVESHDGETFGFDVSIHCPDIMLAHRYSPESEVPAQTGYLIIQAFYSKPESQPGDEKELWTVSILGKLEPSVLNPYLIRGNFYYEPFNKFAFARFDVMYEDAVIDQKTVPKGKEGLLQLSLQQTPFNGAIQQSFIPMTDFNNYWQFHKTSTPQIDPKRTTQLHFDLSKFFNDERPLNNFYFTYQGKVDPEEIDKDVDPYIALGAVIEGVDRTLVIPYVAETHYCQQASQSMKFYHKDPNFKVDIINLSQTTNVITFAFPRNSYRFEGQFDECIVSGMELKNKKEIWTPIGRVPGTDPSGSSFGSLESISFPHPDKNTFAKGSSYRILCERGVTKIRNRNFVDTEELLTFSYLSLDDSTLHNHHHLYHSTLVFSPREHTNLLFIIFMILLGVIGFVILFYLLSSCGVFKWIHRKLKPQMENVGPNIPYEEAR